MGGACSVYERGGGEMCTKLRLEILKGRHQPEAVGVDDRTISKCILRKQGLRV